MVRKKLTPFLRHKPIVMIIEGVDLSGKSTLINALCKEYEGMVFKISYRPHSKLKSETIGLKKYLYSALDYINHNRQTKTILFDRFFPTEMVYSLPMRGYEAFKDRDYRDCEKVICTMPHLFIYCDPGIEVLKDRYSKRGDEHVKISDLQPLWNRYDKFFRETNMRKLRLDTSKPIEELLEEIKKIAI